MLLIMSTPEESPLDMVERHVAEFEMRVTRQRALVEYLRARDSDILATAESLLSNMEDLLKLAREHLRIEQERR